MTCTLPRLSELINCNLAVVTLGQAAAMHSNFQVIGNSHVSLQDGCMVGRDKPSSGL